MRFKYAITRQPGVNFADGLTQATMGDPSYELITEQHRKYVNTLRQMGITVTVLDPLMAYPDAYFVEDPAVVTSEVAVITIPGAPSRQGEQNSLKQVLNQHREVVEIESPGTVDGGDVLMVDKHFFIGISARTNRSGARQLGGILENIGCTWATVPVANGLHLKSDINYIGGNTLLITPKYAQLEQFKEFDKLILSEEESYAANSLWVNGSLIMPKGFHNTKSQLDRKGYDIIELDVSEVRKMDGGLTCLSLRL